MFWGVLPCPDRFVGLDGAFLPCCWWGYRSFWTAATAKPTPTLIRKVLFLFLLGGLEGRSALQGMGALARSVRLTDAPFWFSSDPHRSQA